MRVRKFLWLVVILALVAAACGDDDGGSGLTAEEGVLTVGSDIPFLPFEGFEGETVVGFDADLINEIASRLDLEVEWIDTDFDTIFTQLATGAFDVVASATTITPDRSQQVNFTTPYYRAQQALTVNSNETPEITGVDDLGDTHSVAVQTGTTGAAWAHENLEPQGVEVVEFPEAADTYNALEGGTVTGVIFDEPSAVEEAANREGLAVVAVIDTDEDYGFGVDPARTELLDEMNRVLQDMFDDGTYQEIYDRWFDAPAGSVLYEEM
ncbi:MAG TPA: transporter substrate-binding domain-containing protein [Acidimicrobiia bacterium]|nr:transporter substrate-binding domain-containing protein [Acidimicrobiia bacterium]